MQLKTAENLFFMIALFSVTGAVIYMFLPFFQPILWAIIFSILLYPIYKKINIVLKNESIASVLTIILFAIVILLPIYIIANGVYTQSIELFIKLKDNQINLESIAAKLPIKIDSDYLSLSAEAGAGTIATSIFDAAKATGNFIIHSLLMIYILFFFLKDGEKILTHIKKALPTKDEYEQIVFEKFAQTTKALFKGTLFVALVQSSIGAISLALTGVQNIMIWWFVMFILSVFPAFGPALVLAPFALYYGITGEFALLTIVLTGAVAASLADNILRPILVGKATGMSDLSVALSILGGVAVWGISGFVLGPVIFSIFLIIWEIYVKLLENKQ